jgi:hypothetical protein
MLLQRILGTGSHLKYGGGQGKLAKAAAAASAANQSVAGKTIVHISSRILKKYRTSLLIVGISSFILKSLANPILPYVFCKSYAATGTTCLPSDICFPNI